MFGIGGLFFFGVELYVYVWCLYVVVVYFYCLCCGGGLFEGVGYY